MKGFVLFGRVCIALVLAAAVWGSGGCGILDEGTPSNARVILEGGGGESFSLVTSNNFTVLADQSGETSEIILNQADTLEVSAPFSQQYSLGSGIRFYLKAFRESGLAEPVNVKVLVGGEQRYNSTSTLDGLSMEFVYTYR